MPRRTGTDHEEKDSLVPTISREEERLRTVLDEARAEAQRIVAEAEQAGGEKALKAAAELPTLLEGRRAELLRESQRRADALREELALRTKETLNKAQHNIEQAVSIVVSAVWPLGQGEVK